MLHICRELLPYPVQEQRLLPLNSGYSASINPAPIACVVHKHVQTSQPQVVKQSPRSSFRQMTSYTSFASTADRSDTLYFRAAHCNCHHTLLLLSYIPARTSFTALTSTLRQQAASKAANATQHLCTLQPPGRHINT